MFLRSIQQWYKQVTNLDRYWRENKKEKERLRRRRKIRNLAPRTNALANVKEIWQ